MNDALAQLFYDEATEMLEHIDGILLSVEESGGSRDDLDALFRYAHTLKGNSAAMGLLQISRFTHGLESALDGARRMGGFPGREACVLLLEANSRLRRMLDASQTQGDVADEACEKIVSDLTGLIANERGAQGPANDAVGGPAVATQRYSVRFAPGPDLDAANDPLRLLSELSPYGRVTCCAFASQTPPLESLKPTRCAVEWHFELETGSNPTFVRAMLELSAPGAHVDITAAPTHLTVTLSPTVAMSESFDPLRTLSELRKHARVVSCSARGASAPVESLNPEVCGWVWEVRVASENGADQLRTVLASSCPADQITVTAREAERDAPVVPASKGGVVATPTVAPQRAADQTTVRVSTAKVDALINLVGEVAIAHAALSDVLSGLQHEGANAAVGQMDRCVRELHERVMAMRMVPVESLFGRFPRLVRDLSTSLGKHARLEIVGGDMELDRSLLGALTDPLTHILRNCCDHGIEDPQARAAAGKPDSGTITIRAFQSEGAVSIEVTDDGKGIDLERVRAKATEHGWLRADETPSEETLFGFVFRPGLSTSDAVSAVSGRGVGMDVVRRNVESLGGSVQLRSQLGVGTSLTLRVPLTLAIMDGLALRAGGETYVVPLTSVVESFRPEAVTISSVFLDRRVADVRGHLVPVTWLSEVLGGAAGTPDDALLVVLEADGEQAAVLVDAIEGQAQLVVKGVDANCGRVQGIAGATITGEGTVALILDVAEIVRRARSQEMRVVAA